MHAAKRLIVLILRFLFERNLVFCEKTPCYTLSITSVFILYALSLLSFLSKQSIVRNKYKYKMKNRDVSNNHINHML